jgi:hypothetical protein
MEKFFIIFWVALILGSIAWYGFLVFYVGFKAGRDIRTLVQSRIFLPKTASEAHGVRARSTSSFRAWSDT